MCEHKGCEHSLGPGSHCDECIRQIEQAGLDMSRSAGESLREMMLGAGMSSVEISKAIKEVFDKLTICGIPYRAVGCEHCQGRGWVLPPNV